MARSNLIDLTVELKHTTDLAYLISDGNRTVWIPKSQCELEKNLDSTYTLTLEEHLALEKGLL